MTSKRNKAWLSCSEIVELATEANEGQLRWGDRLKFVAHRLTCRGCRRYLRQLTDSAQALSRLRGAGLSATAKAQLMEAFQRKGKPHD